MFSGIVETTAQILDSHPRDGVLSLLVERPKDFNDLSLGDSVAVDGVCLTLENFSTESMRFALAAETLQTTQWSSAQLKNRIVNLERSLRFGDRVHGQLMTGHVDSRGEVVAIERLGESRLLEIKLPKEYRVFLHKKGSIVINGVSLTVNKVEADQVSLCLIPETLNRTNLSLLNVGEFVNFEVDQMARLFVNWMKSKSEEENEI